MFTRKPHFRKEVFSHESSTPQSRCGWKLEDEQRPQAAKALITELAPLVKDAACEVVLCVPFTNLETALTLCEGTNLRRCRKAALDAGLKVILCVGEVLEQREQGITEEIVSLQTKVALGGVSREELANIIIAYEPVWAIGTGKTATADQAEEVCSIIRGVVSKLYDQSAADALTIQYGGSMKPGNAKELLSKEDVDGGLIGGAALVAKDFAAIIDAAR